MDWTNHPLLEWSIWPVPSWSSTSPILWHLSWTGFLSWAISTPILHVLPKLGIINNTETPSCYKYRKENQVRRPVVRKIKRKPVLQSHCEQNNLALKFILFYFISSQTSLIQPDFHGPVVVLFTWFYYKFFFSQYYIEMICMMFQRQFTFITPCTFHYESNSNWQGKKWIRYWQSLPWILNKERCVKN